MLLLSICQFLQSLYLRLIVVCNNFGARRGTKGRFASCLSSRGEVKVMFFFSYYVLVVARTGTTTSTEYSIGSGRGWLLGRCRFSVESQFPLC